MAEIHRSYFYSIDCLRRRNLLCLLILNYTNIESMMSMFIITRNMCFSHQHKTPGLSHCHMLIFPILFSNNIVNLDLCDVFSFCIAMFFFILLITVGVTVDFVGFVFDTRKNRVWSICIFLFYFFVLLFILPILKCDIWKMFALCNMNLLNFYNLKNVWRGI